MYQKSSDQLNYIERTASHSTKESKTGRIDAIPSWAREPEEYYNTLRDRWRSILDQLTNTQNKLAEINETLRHTLPHKEYEHLAQHKERLAERHCILQQQQAEYRPMARAAGERAWATVFYCVARKLLTPEDFRLLITETKSVLGREEGEIRKGLGEKSEQSRESERAHQKRKDRRTHWRKHKGGSVTVWADNRPIKQQFADEKRTKD